MNEYTKKDREHMDAPQIPLKDKLIRKSGAEVGDTIRLVSGAEAYTGILMPHHEFSDPNIITIKLPNGYNIGVEATPNTTIEVIERKTVKREEIRTIPHDPAKPTIAIIGTGGTIASYVDYRTGAVHPALSAEELAFSMPELTDMCNIKAKVLYSIFSEDMTVAHWQKLAREVAAQLNAGVEGVIIPHGTDTLGYTSAALSFMLSNLSGPVVLVGSQRSSDRPSSDATINLISSTSLIVNSDIGEVVVVMHGTISDTHAAIYRGTKVRKMHTSRRDAFQAINTSPIGHIRGEEIEFFQKYTPKRAGEVECNTQLDDKVSLLYFYPGLDSEHFDFIAERSHGVVIAGTGLGHIATRLIGNIKKAIKNGVHIIMTSQCLHGRVNMNVYSTGRDLLKVGVIPGEDMLPETAWVKLMWVLGQTSEPSEVKKLMLTNLAGEITSRTRIHTS